MMQHEMHIIVLYQLYQQSGLQGQLHVEHIAVISHEVNRMWIIVSKVFLFKKTVP